MGPRAPGSSAKAVAAQDIEDNVEDGHDDRHNDADYDHDNIRNGGDYGINRRADSRENRTHYVVVRFCGVSRWERKESWANEQRPRRGQSYPDHSETSPYSQGQGASSLRLLELAGSELPNPRLAPSPRLHECIIVESSLGVCKDEQPHSGPKRRQHPSRRSPRATRHPKLQLHRRRTSLSSVHLRASTLRQLPLPTACTMSEQLGEATIAPPSSELPPLVQILNFLASSPADYVFPSPSLTMATYDSLHRQCRTLEALFDTKLTAYARLASSITRNQDDLESGGSSERWKDLDNEVDELLEKLQEINDQLSTLSNDTENPPSQSMLRAIQRHREVYLDYARELRRTKSNVKTALDQANLLSGVRNDIDAYKSSAADSLLAERGRIDSSHRMTDDMIAQAYETRAEFGRQRTTISGINSRMQGVLSSMPGINNLLSMIKTRRRRDALIIGCVIGLGTVLLLMYVF